MYRSRLKLESFVHCTSTATIRLTEEAKLPEDLREYLSWEPTKERSYRGWRFLAPDQIVRSEEDQFYHIAMHRMPGAVETISWRRDINQWQVRTYMDAGTFHAEPPQDATVDVIIDRLRK